MLTQGVAYYAVLILYKIWCLSIVFFYTTCFASTPLSQQEFSQISQHIHYLTGDSPLKAIAEIDRIKKDEGNRLTPRQRIRLIYAKTWALVLVDRLEEALRELAECKTLDAELDESLLFFYYGLTATIFDRVEMYELALENYLYGYRISIDNDRDNDIKLTESNIGTVYLAMGHLQQAEHYFDLFYQDVLERKDEPMISLALSNLGKVAFDRGNFELAYTYFNDALKKQEALNFNYFSSESHYHLGKIYRQRREMNNALTHLNTAIDIATDSGSLSNSIAPMIEKAHLNMELEQYEQALKGVAQSIRMAIEFNRHTSLAEAYLLQASIYTHLKQFDLALKATRKYADVKVALSERQSQVSVAYYLAEVDVTSKELDIANLTKENSIRELSNRAIKRQFLLFIVAAFIIAGLLVFFLHRIRGKNHLQAKTLKKLKETQKQLLEAEKLSALTVIVSGMAHQLNTPLGILVTSTSILTENLQDIKSAINERKLTQKMLSHFIEQAGKALELVRNNSSKAADLVEKFKLIAASLKGTQPTLIELQPFINDNLIGSLGKYDIEVTTKVDGDSVHIEGYPELLSNALEQLIDNSVHHGFKGTSDNQINIAIQEKDDWVTLTYQDNGRGIENDKLSQIFTPFYTTSIQHGNLGIGLNIVYNSIAVLMGGQVSAQPAVQGVTFVMEFSRVIRGTE
jgi:signal transduction histidine kinase